MEAGQASETKSTTLSTVGVTTPSSTTPSSTAGTTGISSEGSVTTHTSRRLFKFTGNLVEDEATLIKIHALPKIEGMLRLTEKRRCPTHPWQPITASGIKEALHALGMSPVVQSIFDAVNKTERGSVVVAGGCLVGALNPYLHTKKKHVGVDPSCNRLQLLPPMYKGSDIDLFFVRHSAHYKELAASLTEELAPEWISRSSFAYTCHHPRTSATTVQLVLHHNACLEDVICEFDVDCCGVAYDGKDLYMTEFAAQALTQGCNVARFHRHTTVLEKRLLKYYHRGFDVAFPRDKLENWVDVDPALLHTRYGLAYLLFPGYREWCVKHLAATLTEGETVQLGDGNPSGYDADTAGGCESLVGQIYHDLCCMRDGVIHMAVGERESFEVIWAGAQPPPEAIGVYRRVEKPSDCSDHIKAFCNAKRDIAPPMSLIRDDLTRMCKQRFNPIQEYNWFCRKDIKCPQIDEWIKANASWLALRAKTQELLCTLSGGLVGSVARDYAIPAREVLSPTDPVWETEPLPALTEIYNQLDELSPAAAEAARGSATKDPALPLRAKWELQRHDFIRALYRVGEEKDVMGPAELRDSHLFYGMARDAGSCLDQARFKEKANEEWKHMQKMVKEKRAQWNELAKRVPVAMEHVEKRKKDMQAIYQEALQIAKTLKQDDPLPSPKDMPEITRNIVEHEAAARSLESPHGSDSDDDGDDDGDDHPTPHPPTPHHPTPHHPTSHPPTPHPPTSHPLPSTVKDEVKEPVPVDVTFDVGDTGFYISSPVPMQPGLIVAIYKCIREYVPKKDEGTVDEFHSSVDIGTINMSASSWKQIPAGLFDAIYDCIEKYATKKEEEKPMGIPANFVIGEATLTVSSPVSIQPGLVDAVCDCIQKYVPKK